MSFFCGHVFGGVRVLVRVIPQPSPLCPRQKPRGFRHTTGCSTLSPDECFALIGGVEAPVASRRQLSRLQRRFALVQGSADRRCLVSTSRCYHLGKKKKNFGLEGCRRYFVGFGNYFVSFSGASFLESKGCHSFFFILSWRIRF